MVNKTAVVVCGRFNPPTKGHYYLISSAEKYAAENGFDFWLLPTRSEGNERNPLPHKLKIEILKELFPMVNIVDDSYVKHLYDLVEMLRCYGYNHFIGIGDEERRSYYEGVEDLEYISLGDRTNQQEGLLAISATKVRESAIQGNVEKYLSMMPEQMSLKRLDECYNKIREYS